MTESNDLLDRVFRHARTPNGFIDKPVSIELLREIYELTKMGPTSMNTQPTRYVFLTTEAAKARLMPALMPGNVQKVRQAPVVAIVATDTRFYEFMPQVFPHNPNAQAMFEGNPALATGTATRNGTLGSAYFMVAARALGLDCGPMSGFDAAKVNAEFFPDGRWQVNYLLNLGHGDPAGLFERSPRLGFDQVSVLL
ncbi:malonic semialdehyde reductase [Pelomonas sp. KK5]|uniref:malonic semialdehyde reductase n=1 Tax=Pelomonas sp. KK5 TaxID=1855730 RepID=UPI00097C1E95|nr:malonic semialdehyde reductase [Pelomonas sp. KK5]